MKIWQALRRLPQLFEARKKRDWDEDRLCDWGICLLVEQKSTMAFNQANSALMRDQQEVVELYAVLCVRAN